MDELNRNRLEEFRPPILKNTLNAVGKRGPEYSLNGGR